MKVSTSSGIANVGSTNTFQSEDLQDSPALLLALTDACSYYANLRKHDNSTIFEEESYQRMSTLQQIPTHRPLL